MSALHPAVLRDGSKALQNLGFLFFAVIRDCFLLLPLVLTFLILQ